MSTLLPAAPPPTLPSPAIPATSAGNPFLDWLHLVDSDGGFISHYRLMLEPGTFNVLHTVFYGGFTEFCYSLGYLVGSSYAAALMQLLLDPNKWLTPLTNFYYRVTSHIYDKVPPTLIMVVTFGFLLFVVFAVRSGTSASALPAQARMPGGAAPGLVEQWLPSNTQITKAQWQRLGSGLVMMSVVAFFTANPFAIVREIVNGVLEIGNALSFTESSGGTAHVISAASADMIRSMTFLVNYRGFLGADCAHQWSTAINVGAGNPRCLTDSQWAATDPDWVTVGLAILSVLVAWAMLSFALTVAIEFVKHLTLSVACAVGATWVAAVTLANRRPYDPLAAVAARAAVHALLAIGVLLISSAGPGLLLHVLTDVLPVPTLLQILIAAVSYYASGKAILFLMEKKTSLLSLFKSKITRSKLWLNLYQQNAPATVMSTAFGGAFDKPTAWAQRNYRQIRDNATATWQNARAAAGTWASDQNGGTSVPTAIIDDTPEFTAATDRIKLYDKPTERVIISGDTPAFASDDAVAPVAVPSLDGTVTPAVPSSGDIPQPAAHAAGPSLPPVWFRGGLPQFVPAADQFRLPPIPPPASNPAPAPIPSLQPPTALSTPGRPELIRPRFMSTTQADAAHLHDLTPPQTIDEALAHTTQTLHIHDTTHTPPPPPARPTGPPDLRSVLSAAQWTQKFNHHRNKLRARGVEDIPETPDGEDAVERIVFATDTAGKIRIEPKNERGFGDWV